MLVRPVPLPGPIHPTANNQGPQLAVPITSLPLQASITPASEQGQPRVNAHHQAVSKWSQDSSLSIFSPCCPSVLLPNNPPASLPSHPTATCTLLPFLAPAPSVFANSLTNCAQTSIVFHLQLQLSQLPIDARNLNLLPSSASWRPLDFSLTMLILSF